jgi:hypothetical protein
MPSWRGAQLKKKAQGQLCLYFYLSHYYKINVQIKVTLYPASNKQDKALM